MQVLHLHCVYYGSGFDRGPFENTFFCDKVRTQKPFTLCFGPRSQSIGRGRISREGALDHRESRERRDKIVLINPQKIAGKTEKNAFLA